MEQLFLNKILLWIKFKLVLNLYNIYSNRKYTNKSSILPFSKNTNEPGHEKTCLMSYATNKGADQPAHPRSLISAFVVRWLNSVMSLVSVTKLSRLMLAPAAE